MAAIILQNSSSEPSPQIVTVVQTPEPTPEPPPPPTSNATTAIVSTAPPTQTLTPTPTRDATPVTTPRPTQLATTTPVPTQAFSPTPTRVPTATRIPIPTFTPVPTPLAPPTLPPIPTPIPTLVPTPTPTPTPPPSTLTEIGDGSLNAGQIAHLVIQLTNARRQRRGLPALLVDPAISKIAQGHSQNMATTGIFEHEIAGQGPTDRALAANYTCRNYREDGSYTYGLSENIYEISRVQEWTHTTRGSSTTTTVSNFHRTAEEVAEALVASWMDSLGHRTNIIDPDARRIGVGVYVQITEMFGYALETYWVTQNFSECRAIPAEIAEEREKAKAQLVEAVLDAGTNHFELLYCRPVTMVPTYREFGELHPDEVHRRTGFEIGRYSDVQNPYVALVHWEMGLECVNKKNAVSPFLEMDADLVELLVDTHWNEAEAGMCIVQGAGVSEIDKATSSRMHAWVNLGLVCPDSSDG